MKRGILSALVFSAVLAHAAPIQVNDLRVDFQSNPTGVGSLPSLSWKLQSDERGKRQSGYHVLAASSIDKLTPETADLWNSKFQKGAFKHLVSWRGKALKNGQKVHWKVKVQDEDQRDGDWSQTASFTVGGKKTLQKPIRISEFESSSDNLNSLFAQSLTHMETHLANFSEGGSGNLGTGAQVQRSARAFLYHFDAIPHLNHWIHQMDKGMTKEGFFPTQPGSKSAGSISSEAAITVNHPLWWMGGNAGLVKERWGMFEKHMRARENADKTFKGSPWGGLTESEGVPAEFLDLCYLGFTTRLTRELAIPAQEPLNVIRFDDYAARIRLSFEKQFITEDGSLKVKSQTAHLLALRCAVLKSEQQKVIIAALMASLKKEGLQVGPIGAYFLPGVLTLTKHHDEAVKMLTELSDDQKKIFAGNGVSEWLMSFLAGIKASSQGFGEVLIAPRIPTDHSLTSVKASYDSVAGKISVHWQKQEGGSLKVDVTIPAGTMARIILPRQKGQTVTEGGRSIQDALGVGLAAQTDSAISLISQSGTYSFLIK
ncbi:MAG: hypothetical protein ACI9NQ_001204 [Paracoccaceae bacterium]|jgi:alpha-L-rhamnosidase